MPAFKFKMAEHVTVPTLGVPGRIYRRIDTAGAENTYILAYLNDICGAMLTERAVSESDLIAAQPKPVDPVDQVEVVAKTAAKLPANEFKPQRRPAAKIKRKSRR